MKVKDVAFVLLVVLLSAGTTLCAESKSTNTRPYIGILLDPTPIPDLLIKHLGLLPDQGIRIRNVHRGSPADMAGLERDDIIIGFQGENVTDYQKFVDAVRKAGVGTEVSLEIIHLGKRKTIKLKLATLKGKPDWKYPLEPEIMQLWRPGKMFRLKPGEESWIELEFPFDGKIYAVDCYHHSGEGESYTITIEGNPNDKDAKITVRIGDTEYKTTVKEIDRLPTKYRDTAKEDLERARKSYRQRKHVRKFSIPSPPTPKIWRYFFKDERLAPPPELRFGPGEKMFDKIKKQMRDLQKRIEELEKRNEELLERFLGEPNKREAKVQEEKQRQRV